MSFKFNWKFFDLEDLQVKCQTSLTESIAAVSRPPVIVKPMQVTDIEFGTVPPELAFHSIPSVSLKRAHVVFALKYSGDASLTLETSIEANPFREPYFDPELPAFVQPKVIAATDSLILPFRLKLKDIVLDTLVDVVYTKSGVLVNFHDDPVKSVGAESSLDMIPGVKNLLGGILRQSITTSFYEDVPESVWTVSSPHKQAPDSWYGARRWSQHDKQFVRFASFIVNSLGAKSRQFQPKFLTLALNVETPELRLPKAILSRASLPRLTQAFQESSHSPNLTPQGLTNLFEAGSDISSIRSSITTSSHSGRQRPKRRVISLRQLSRKDEAPGNFHKERLVSDSAEYQAKSPDNASIRRITSTGLNADNNQTNDDQTNNKQAQRNGSQANRMHNRQLSSTQHASSNKGYIKVSTEALTPPVFDSDDGATDTEHDTNLFGDSLEHLLPPDGGCHRRFSTPDDNRIDRRRRLLPSKMRTASMQPTGTTPLMHTTSTSWSARSAQSPHAQPPHSPRSPRSRLVSTNDLMNK